MWYSAIACNFLNILLEIFGNLQKFSLHRENNFFESKKVLSIQKNVIWFKEIDLFTLKKILLNQQNFLQFKEMFSLTVYQRNVSLIQRNCFLGLVQNIQHFLIEN